MLNHFTRILASASVLLTLTSCERAEPTSYLIPKEERNVAMPSPVAESNQPAPAPAPAASNTNKRVMPGMQEEAKQSGEVSYTAPEGWKEFPASGIRKANLKVTDANGSAELTVLAFPGDVGGRLANINRWRGQIALDPATPEDLPEFTESYTIAGHRGLYIRLEGKDQSILGALLPFHDNTWFFKLMGDHDTVFANEAGMKAFLDSVALEDKNH